MGLTLSLPFPFPIPPTSLFAVALIMPVTPPPPPTPPPAASPPTSPQRHQQATRHQERLERQMGSPEQRRIPFASTTPLDVPPPPPPISDPVIFNGQTFHHLPSHIVSGMRQLQQFPPISTRQRAALSVSCSSFFSNSLLC